MSNFRDVDRALDPRRSIEYLDGSAKSMVDAKARLRTMAGLDGCSRWLDVGCGVGHDVAGDPNGVGIDFSQKLLAEGRTRWPAARLLAADGHTLPFADHSFDGCRVERVLQHLVDPTAVIDEVRRVLQPGARLAVFEPDWESFTVNAEDHELTRAFAVRAAERTRHGRIGRQLAARMAEAGFLEVKAEAETVSWQSLKDLRRLFAFDALAEALGAEWGDRARAWLAELERRDAKGSLWAFLTRHYVVAVAPRPDRQQ